MIDVSSYSAGVQILALCRYSGVTPRLFEALLRRFNTLEQILLADRAALLEIEGLTQKAARLIERAPERLSEAAQYQENLSAREIKFFHRMDENYPSLFFQLNDPPPMLYYKGQPLTGDSRSVTIVGASEATPRGLQVTSSLVRELVRHQIRIVSSLSPGVDMTALLTCLSAEGRPVAVCEQGFDRIINEAKIRLAVDVAAKGTVISEYSPEVEPDKVTLRQADRLMVGLSHAVVVTEVYGESERVLDILNFCRDIGKLAFYMIDPDHGVLADESSLARALECGVIPIKGFEHVEDIIKSLV